jgi:hypothetical protein
MTSTTMDDMASKVVQLFEKTKNLSLKVESVQNINYDEHGSPVSIS